MAGRGGAVNPSKRQNRAAGSSGFSREIRELARCGVLAQAGRQRHARLTAERTFGRRHWNVMSRHFEMSEPRPEEMVMQPRIFCAVVSAAQTE